MEGDRRSRRLSSMDSRHVDWLKHAQEQINELEASLKESERDKRDKLFHDLGFESEHSSDRGLAVHNVDKSARSLNVNDKNANENDLRLGESASSRLHSVSGRSRRTSSSLRSSFLSSRLKEAEIKKAVAELKQKQLLMGQELERKRQELIWQIENVQLQNEIEQANLEEKMLLDTTPDANVKTLHDVNTSQDPPHKRETSMNVDDIASFRPEPSQQKSDPQPVPSMNPTKNSHRPKTNQMSFPVSNPVHSVPVPKADTDCSDHSSQNNAQFYASMAQTLNMPKPEFMTFYGDPTQYWKFITNFDTNIACKVQDNRTRLSYLIQHCHGEAKECIEDCIILEENEGYKRAREMLQKRFGRPHVIAHAYVNQLVNGPTIKPSDGQGLLKLTLTQMGYQADINNSDNLVKIVRRLPMHVRGKWVDKADSLLEAGIEPSFHHLTCFIESKARAANNMYGQDLAKGPEKPNKPNNYNRPARNTFTTQVNPPKHQNSVDKSNSTSYSFPKCLRCNGSHALERCYKFQDMAFDDRRKFIREKRLCDNCFQSGHISRGCTKASKCNVNGCKRKHNTTLHPPSENLTQASETEVKQVASDKDPNTIAASSGSVHATEAGRGKGKVCLKIVPVEVLAPGANQGIKTYALLDNCSDVSLCERRLVDQLGVKGTEKSYNLTTVNKQGNNVKGFEVHLSAKALDSGEIVDIPRVWTIDKLPISSACIPKSEDFHHWPHLRDIQVPEVDSSEVTLLIGSDVPEVFWALDERRGKRKQPYAVRSLLGWTMIGPAEFNTQNSFNVNFVRFEDELLHLQVEQFWKTDFNDSLADSKLALSREDQDALSIMKNTISMIDGHYQLSLPWRHSTPSLSDNRMLAEARLRLLRKRMDKDSDLKEKYTATVCDYIAKGYAREVPQSMIEPEYPIWYLPHHPVIHPQKPGKVRVVFDCAARYKGTSLNEQLLQGPDLNNNLIGVLLRFRQGPVAIAADIEAMFHQVRVTPRDCDVLRFLWWPNGDLSQPPTDHQMLVHLFGATSSPSCCSFALRKTADDNKDYFDKETVETVENNFYVDDCLKSVETEEAAIRLVNQLNKLLALGGFRLTKWMSNRRNILTSIPASERAKSVMDLDLDHLPVERTLGVLWNVESDKFEFRSIKKDKPTTRRGILSLVSSLYDPLGFVAPIIFVAKLLLQDLCRQKLGWDEAVGDVATHLWENWLEDLPHLSKLSVGRCLKPSNFGDTTLTQIHHFADASVSGYGAVSYLRIIDVSGAIHCSFLLGKSRLAPLKSISIPRLELSAAVVAVKLDGIIKAELGVSINQTVFWTDSTSVLQYIANKSRRFQTFVANRLAIIHDNSEVSQWRHISTKLNPADYASRGLKTTETSKIETWLKGPEFLWCREEDWPVQVFIQMELRSDDPELKREVTVNFTKGDSELDSLLQRYSSWYALQKAMAWLLRYKTFCINKYRIRNQIYLNTGELLVHELHTAQLVILQYVQTQTFPNEICQLKNSSGNAVSTVKLSSPLRRLSPMLVDGMLRVGGRLERAPVHYEAKHQLILPNKHHVTDLIIKHNHSINGHSGTDYVLASLRQQYWILNGRAAVKRVIKSCFSCRKRNAPVCEQYMAALPTERLLPDKPPFTYVGVDYFGPFFVKQGRSSAKRYGCLFTCLTIRAVHIEIAHSLETDSLINAVQRFISRRGRPEVVYSDNGSNFKGGERELKEAIEQWNQSRITDVLRQQTIEWKFNPPAASHMGGVWERMIRSARKILRAILGEQIVNDETLLTVMAEVERILNDRPITHTSGDPTDPEPLTPSKLLLLKSNTCLPPGVFVKEDQYLTRRWKQAQYLASIFWKRWLAEYLPTLQERQKWLKPRRNLHTGDVVLISDSKTVRGKWPLGRVISTRMDNKGLVRSVEVRTADSILVRPVAKLCLLESDNDDAISGATQETLSDAHSVKSDTTDSAHLVEPAQTIDSRKETVVDSVRKSKRLSKKPKKFQDYV